MPCLGVCLHLPVLLPVVAFKPDPMNAKRDAPP